MSDDVKIGRPSLGVTKKVSITLPKEVWEKLDDILQNSECRSKSELFREVLTWFANNSKH